MHCSRNLTVVDIRDGLAGVDDPFVVEAADQVQAQYAAHGRPLMLGGDRAGNTDSRSIKKRAARRRTRPGPLGCAREMPFVGYAPA
jgi:hypothetical protein